MNVFDNDLISIQEARILAENTAGAKRLLADFSQDRLDKIVISMLENAERYIKELAVCSFRETGYGNISDKIAKNRFVCENVRQSLAGMKCVGFIEEDAANAAMKVGVPVGTVLAFIPATSPVSAAIFNAVIAVKSGNALIVSPHPRAQNTIKKVLDILIDAAVRAGLPIEALSYQNTVSASGTEELINHPEVNFILNTGAGSFLETIKKSGKPFICSGSGNGPSFIEQTADIKNAVGCIIESKTFDNGIVSAAENSVIVERCIEDETRKEFKRQGAYFMEEAEAKMLGKFIYTEDGHINPDAVGISAYRLAKRAGFCVGSDVKLLIAKGKYSLNNNLYSKEKLFPVLAYYIEDDWRNACEKCIELLLFNNGGHTLVIHSNDDYVIRQFALKKPVARVLVNTPASLGGMGITTNLFPSMIFGSGKPGEGYSSENVSPMNLVFIRSICYGVRNVDSIRKKADDIVRLKDGEEDKEKILKELLEEVIKIASKNKH